MKIYNYLDYKSYFKAWVEAQPNKGHGEYRRLSQALKVSTTMISQVFNGDKQLSLEMALEMAEYLNLEEDETEYLLLLVEHAKAGSFKLQKQFERQIKIRRDLAQKVESRLKKATQLSDAVKAIYYSSWMYSGIQLLTDIPEFKETAAIAERLHLPKNQVQKVLDFLKQHQLVVQKDGKYAMGPTTVYIGSSNHLVVRHHQNWRLQGFQRMVQSADDDFFYTSAYVLSRKAAEMVRRELPDFVQKIRKMAVDSDSEETRCLNIDWFRY